MVNYKDLYDETYYKQYDVGVTKVDYEDSQYTKAFLYGVAEKIVEQMNPKTVLDVGCAMGYLVQALREKGVEAYGIDISEYAISKANESVKEYCACCSALDELPETFPKSFDLITTIEVVEHLEEQDGKTFIEKLCRHSSTILFSSTPDPDEEPTHFNVQPEEYWLREFGKNNYFNNLEKKPTYLTYHAKVFRRKDNALEAIIDYERAIKKINNSNDAHIRTLNEFISQQDALKKALETDLEKAILDSGELEARNKELKDKTEELKARNKELEDKNEEISLNLQTIKNEKECLETNLKMYQKHYNDAIQQRNLLQKQLEAVSLQYEVISNSTCWNMTKPIRKALDAFKALAKKNKTIYLSYKGFRCLKENGVAYTVKIAKKRLMKDAIVSKTKKHNIFDDVELNKQRLYQFKREIKFSIVVPLYNTPEKFLREMIESVQNQTYANWELCLADGSDEHHTEVGGIVNQYSRNDKRIIYKKLECNRGISNNTNAGIEISTGDYIGLLDHDDILHPSALFECMKAICEKGSDFIYTDENTFTKSPSDAYCPHFKPDYSPDTLRSYNYICHLSVFSRELLEKVGAFRSEFDGSQDYDMVLRLTEAAKCVTHIPRILYYWRSHQNSVAMDVSAKPYVIDAAKGALAAHLQRVGLEGEVVDSSVTTTYKINYRISGLPLISILIPNKDHVDDLKKCVDSIRAKTTYKNYEIIIIENNSTEKETFSFYEGLQDDQKIRVVEWRDEFNYSAINNFGVQHSGGDYLLFLNNDVEVITPNWIEELLMFAQRSDVGAVGAKLFYPDDTIQHAGVILGVGGVGGHSHKHFNRKDFGYMSRLTIAQNLSACTAACLLVSRSVFDKVGGFDESLKVAFNDVDLCMKIRRKGYLIVFTPYAELYHHESKSRGYEDTPEKQRRFQNEVFSFQNRWKKELEEGDPYYNPNLTLDREDYSIR